MATGQDFMQQNSDFHTLLSGVGRGLARGMLVALSLSAAAWGGTFGTVVPIGKVPSPDSPVGGLASDIALDEA